MRSRVRWILAFLGAPVLALCVLICWSLASPVGSSPDDDFHLPAIWCGLGERPGLCEAVDDSTDRLVPTALVNAPCFAFHPEVDASCWQPDQTGLTKVARANADGLYPPLFYAAMAPFASTNVEGSVVAMRIINSAFAVGLLSAVFFTLPRRIRPALLVSVVATCVPLGLFLFASTNPSSWALLSAAVVWVCVYGSTQTSGRRRTTLLALAVFGGLVGAGARADAAIFAVFGAAVGLFVGWRTHRRQWAPAIGVVAIAVISAVFYLNAGQSGAAVDGLSSDAPKLSLSEHVSNFLETPSLWTGALGQANLGWLDTRMPAVVWVLSTAVFAGALFVGLRHVSRRRAIAVAAALAATWIVPFVLFAQSNARVGTMVQPRYILPLMIIAVGVASLRRNAERAWSPMRYGLAALSLLVAATVALHQNIQRYTIGSSARKGFDPGANAQWWWTSAPAPIVVWLVGSIAFAGLLIVIWATARTGDSRLQAPGMVAPAGSASIGSGIADPR